MGALEGELATFEEDGFAVLAHPVSDETVQDLRNELTPLFDALAVVERRGGVRQLFEKSRATRRLASSSPIVSAAKAVLGDCAFPVRALFFDKTPGANWRVIWHQDLTITVQQQLAVPGFDPWTTKGDAPHAQAPARLLERMVAVRVHLDPCGQDNGPLRVIPGSHHEGRLSSAQIAELRNRPEHVCLVPEGGILLMRPLLLHASSSARSPGHRRVVHLEFAREELPGGLSWRERPRPE